MSANGRGAVTVVLAGTPQSRTGVRFGLEHHGFSVVAEASDADEAVAAVRRHRPHVCLLDIDLPGGGIDAADRINAELDETKIAMLSASAERDGVRDAIFAGADGYLLRSMAPDRLTAALNGLVNGEAAFPRSVTAELVHELREIDRRLDGSANGHDMSMMVAGPPPHARREAAARGAAAAHRAAEARRTVEARRLADARRLAEARRAVEARRAAEAELVAEGWGTGTASGTLEWRRPVAMYRAAGAGGPPELRTLGDTVSSRLLYMPRLARHLSRRLRSGMSLQGAWTSARDRMIDYQ